MGVDIIVWVGIAAAGLIALLAIGYVVWPFFQPGPSLPLLDDDHITDLLIRKDNLLRAIKDLDLDFQIGKMSEEDYQRFSARLRRQALTVIQQIDRLAPESAHFDDALEAEIARLRKVQPANPAPVPVNVPATVPGAVKGERLSQSTAGSAASSSDAPPVKPPATLSPQSSSAAQPPLRFCTQCGASVAANHKFCAECGTPVAVLPAKT